MGERRKGEVAVTQVRMAPEPALSAAAPEEPTPRSGRTSGAQVIPLRESRRTRLRATGVAPEAPPPATPRTTGRRRLRVVVAFAVIGFPGGARGADDRRRR